MSEIKYAETVRELDRVLRTGESFDLIRKTLRLGSGEAVLYCVDGFVKDEITEKLIEYYLKSTPEDIADNLPYIETENVPVDGENAIYKLTTAVLSGSTVMVCEGVSDAIIIDTRTYPSRGIEEPENDKVLRGSHDGFGETLIFNTAMIRRRIRDPRLTMSIRSLTPCTRTDLVVCYVDGRCNQKLLDTINKKLSEISVKALNFGIQSVAELLSPSGWWNPFPKFRYTERPDAAAASLLEGSVILLCDACPAAMILPTGALDFVQESGDFTLPPLTGSYLRIVRLMIFALTLLLTPTWYLLISNPQWIPAWLDFLKIAEPAMLPVWAQFLIIEFAVDGLRLASMNTPSALASSLSVVGGLLLGDFAVKSGWFAPDVILYMAFVAIGSFSQSSYELGYALKFMRILILSLTALFGLWGYIAGILLTIISISCVKTIGGRGYLYPLIPFNPVAFSRLITRQKLK